jgi:hypothetical protein
MTQTLYAHMNKIKILKKIPEFKPSLTKKNYVRLGVWGCSSVVECLLDMIKALVLIPSTTHVRPKGSCFRSVGVITFTSQAKRK